MRLEGESTDVNKEALANPSLIAAEGAIANVVGMTQMNPPVKDLREWTVTVIWPVLISVPRMTPILRNRHEKVQEATINLIGRIGEYLKTSHY